MLIQLMHTFNHARLLLYGANSMVYHHTESNCQGTPYKLTGKTYPLRHFQALLLFCTLIQQQDTKISVSCRQMTYNRSAIIICKSSFKSKENKTKRLFFCFSKLWKYKPKVLFPLFLIKTTGFHNPSILLSKANKLGWKYW